MLEGLLFSTMVGLFVAHELDAVRLREWQLLFVLRNLEDGVAYRAFVLAHMPITALFWWLDAGSSAQVHDGFRLGLDAFAVVHAGLHWHLRDRPQSGFRERFSRTLVHAVGLAGAVHAAVRLAAPGA